MSSEFGLQVNLAKCEVLFTNEDDIHTNIAILEMLQLLLPGIEMVSEENLTLLGAPILEQSVGGVLRGKLHDLQLMIKQLDQLDKQDLVFLLHHCFAIPS